MYSISEFSMMTAIPVRTLRYYHEQGLLVPAAVDSETNYRWYNERNLDTAQVIITLRSLEFSLDDIREVLANCRSDADVLEFFEQQQSTIAKRLAHYQNALDKIDQLINHQRELRKEEAKGSTTSNIVERDVEPMLVAGIRMNGHYSDCGRGFATLGKQLGRHIAGTPLCLFYDGEYREGDANFEPCMPIRKVVEVDGIEVRQLPATRCAALIHVGPYEELRDSYSRLLKYVKRRRYDVSLPTREVYLKGPGMIFRGNPKKYRTEIQLPLTAK